MKKINLAVFSFVFFVLAVGLTAGMDWISDRTFGLALLLIMGAWVAISIYAAGRFLTFRPAADAGRTLDETSRKSLDRIIRYSKVSVVYLSIGLVGASVSDLPLTVKIVGGMIDIGIIAAIVGYIIFCRKKRTVQLQTSNGDR